MAAEHPTTTTETRLREAERAAALGEPGAAELLARLQARAGMERTAPEWLSAWVDHAQHHGWAPRAAGYLDVAERLAGLGYDPEQCFSECERCPSPVLHHGDEALGLSLGEGLPVEHEGEALCWDCAEEAGRFVCGACRKIQDAGDETQAQCPECGVCAECERPAEGYGSGSDCVPCARAKVMADREPVTLEDVREALASGVSLDVWGGDPYDWQDYSQGTLGGYDASPGDLRQEGGAWLVTVAWDGGHVADCPLEGLYHGHPEAWGSDPAEEF